jgi:hypothetical protein
MKKHLIILILLISKWQILFANTINDDPNVVVKEMAQTCKKIQEKYAIKFYLISDTIQSIKQQLLLANTIEQKLDLLLKKDLLTDKTINLQNNLNSDVTKTRYLKGLELVKILYDKVLGLDHHFASVRTFSEINKISNPNNYPEFSKLKDILRDKKDKKNFDLTNLLGSNIVASVVNIFSGLQNSGLSKEEKEKEIQAVECIVDFTLRMHNDLNLIYFETSYLQAANEEIKKDIELMFKDYTKPIGYIATLPDCRSNDDWDNLKEKLDKYNALLATTTDKDKINKMQINLEFSIDRLLQFIAKYNNFIDDGVKFYQKFKTILNSYENEKLCDSKLPIEYKKLKTDIDVAIDKFNIAYKPVEINGSKMKEVLYGINEYK